jgi:hypothetical protein
MKKKNQAHNHLQFTDGIYRPQDNHCYKTDQYLIKYKEKWEREVKKTDERDEERERDDETENTMENN